MPKFTATFYEILRRQGHRPIKTPLQVEQIDEELKNSLWSAFLESFLKTLPNDDYSGYKLNEYVTGLWFSFFKLPLDTASIYNEGYGRIGVFKDDLIKNLRKFFLTNKNGTTHMIYYSFRFNMPTPNLFRL